MREIRQSGSEGGATTSRPYPYNWEHLYVAPSGAGRFLHCRYYKDLAPTEPVFDPASCETGPRSLVKTTKDQPDIE
jgi:hypothetical protein